MSTDRNAQAPAAPSGNSDLIYPLDDTPAFAPAIFAALQQVLASFVGSVPGLGAHVPYPMRMVLFVSGLKFKADTRLS